MEIGKKEVKRFRKKWLKCKTGKKRSNLPKIEIPEGKVTTKQN